jgi:type III secretory pathway component EscV
VSIGSSEPNSASPSATFIAGVVSGVVGGVILLTLAVMVAILCYVGKTKDGGQQKDGERELQNNGSDEDLAQQDEETEDLQSTVHLLINNGLGEDTPV